MSLNRTVKFPAVTSLAMIAFCLSVSAASAQVEQINDHVIHYNTLNTSLLTPDVARSYGIQRSANRALLNIAVLREDDQGLNIPVTASVSAVAVNLAGQRRVLDMQEIRDQDAIYYIGTFRIHDQEHLNFQIQVQPEGARRSHQFTFRQQFFTG